MRAEKLSKRQPQPQQRHADDNEDTITVAPYSKVYAIKVDADPRSPRSFKKAINGQDKLEWMGATKEEYESLIANKVFILVARPTEDIVLSGRWIFKIKRAPDGSIARYKARWVVRGFEQEDYDQTFASTVRMTVVRWLLAYTCIKKKKLRQIDFITAFLNSVMTGEKVYVEQVQGYEQDKA